MLDHDIARRTIGARLISHEGSQCGQAAFAVHHDRIGQERHQEFGVRARETAMTDEQLHLGRSR